MTIKKTLCLLILTAWTTLHASAYPFTGDESGCIFGGEFLFWNTSQSNLEFAVDGDFEPLFISPYIVGPGNYHFMDYNADIGYRGYVGYRNGCNRWDFRFVYTYFKNDADKQMKRVDALDPVIFIPTLLHVDTDVNPTGQGFEFGEGKNTLRYQVVDFLFGKTLKFCWNTFTMHPYFGVRLMKLRQDLNAKYVIKQQDSSRTTENMQFESEFRGVGFNTGFDMFHSICWDIDIYGSLGASLLRGRNDNEWRQNQLASDTVTQVVNIDDRKDIFLPGYHIAAGIQHICCRKPGCWVLCRIGYEFNHWFHTPQFRRYDKGDTGISDFTTRGNIGLHGLTLRMEYLF